MFNAFCSCAQKHKPHRRRFRDNHRDSYMSNMQYRWNIMWYQSCGGSLLTQTSLLSAAHCYV